MTRTSVSQSGVEVLYKVTPQAQVHQAGAEFLHTVLPGMRVQQAGVEYLHRVQPSFAIYQAGVEYLYKAPECTPSWTNIWIITRADGQVVRFTSLDRDLTLHDGVYRTCGSLTPTAAENVSGAGEVGSLDLSGLIADGFITFHSLQAGLWDGARIESWLVNWAGADLRRPLMRGTFGAVDFSENNFTVEVMGDGGRLAQTPLISPLQRPCRWIFGDSRCGKDLGPLTVTGTVTTGQGLRSFIDSSRAETAKYFKRGMVTFTTGLNAGLSAEIKEHEDGGIFTLWPKIAYPIVAGDEYAMTPGCTNLDVADGGCNGCTAWANFDNYGGFLDVPGRDHMSETPDVKKSG